MSWWRCYTVGTYNQQEGQASSDQCVDCPVGKFCNETGLSGPAGDCAAGFLCLLHAASPEPNDGVNGPCPVGHYCPEGNGYLHNFENFEYFFFKRI